MNVCKEHSPRYRSLKTAGIFQVGECKDGTQHEGTVLEKSKYKAYLETCKWYGAFLDDELRSLVVRWLPGVPR